MKDNTLKHLSKIAALIAKFLIENGGFQNGYMTYAKGHVIMGNVGNVEVSVNNDSLTIKELAALGRNLERSIQTYMLKNEMNTPLKIFRKHLEWGTYETTVSLSETITVPLSS
jgi:hypothetical protein